MKRFISILVCTVALLTFASPPMKVAAQTFTTVSAAQSQGDYSGYLSTLDTLTNTDTTTYTVSVKGKKHCITLSDAITKISGTVASTIKVYGSTNGGTTYITAPLTTVTITDASAVYGASYTFNGYDKYKIQLITAGTQSFSQRLHILWRSL